MQCTRGGEADDVQVRPNHICTHEEDNPLLTSTTPAHQLGTSEALHVGKEVRHTCVTQWARSPTSTPELSICR